MKSRIDVAGDSNNTLGAKTFLEFCVHILDLGFFNPVVFSHDQYWFDRKKYAQVRVGFLNLLSFLYSCGVTLQTVTEEPSDLESLLYGNIMRDSDMTSTVLCYRLGEADFTAMNMTDASIPPNCREEDFALVKLYLQLRTGAALNRKAIEKLIGRDLTDQEMLTLRKQFKNITGREMIKRKDNSYEMMR